MSSVFGAVGVGYSKSDVFEFGSTKWGIRVVTDTTGAGSDVWASGPWRISSKYTPTTAKKQKTGEDGEQLTTKTDTNYVLEITTGQKDLPSLIELMKAAQGQTCQFIIEHTTNHVGSAGKRIYSTCMGTPADLPAIDSTADVVYKFDLVKSTGSISVSLADSGITPIGFGSTTGSIVQASGDYFGFTAVS